MSSQQISPVFDTWVPGLPSPFANPPHEALWKQALMTSLPDAIRGGAALGLAVDFVLAAGRQTGRDLDNLCEPVLSVLVNKKGWFGGKRPGISWIEATKRAGQESGARIRVVSDFPDWLHEQSPDLILDGVYERTFPTSARDAALADWCLMYGASSKKAETFQLSLRFGSASINLGDMATGPIKSIIDCLYPVIGGSPGAPEDWRVTSLRVIKNHSAIPANWGEN